MKLLFLLSAKTKTGKFTDEQQERFRGFKQHEKQAILELNAKDRVIALYMPDKYLPFFCKLNPNQRLIFLRKEAEIAFKVFLTMEKNDWQEITYLKLADLKKYIKEKYANLEGENEEEERVGPEENQQADAEENHQVDPEEVDQEGPEENPQGNTPLTDELLQQSLSVLEEIINEDSSVVNLSEENEEESAMELLEENDEEAPMESFQNPPTDIPVENIENLPINSLPISQNTCHLSISIRRSRLKQHGAVKP